MSKILIVEDEVALAEKIREWLVHEKYVVEVSHDGKDALALLKTYSYDVVVLDWQLPGLEGIEICRQFRAHGGITPVIFLTGKDTIPDKEAGLDSGADDYLTKPFHVRELSARIRACLRRPGHVQAEVLTVGDLSLETKTLKVFKADKPIALQPKELALLEYLMRHPAEVFSAKALLDKVWNADSNASEDTIRTYMKTLRRKITAEGEECLIKTIHGLGYKIEAN